MFNDLSNDFGRLTQVDLSLYNILLFQYLKKHVVFKSNYIFISYLSCFKTCKVDQVTSN
jgi:hypothetical protein